MSILRVTPFNEEYKDEQDEEVANIVIEKIKKESEESAHIALQTTSSFDPTVMCLLAIRQPWYDTRPASCYLLPIFASIVALSHWTLATYIFFGAIPTDYDAWWADLNILRRGAHDGYMSFSVLRHFCMALLVCWQLPDVVKLVSDLQLQIYVLEPLQPEHYSLPIVASVGFILDISSVAAMLLAGLVYVSEVETADTTADLLVSLAMLVVLSMFRKYLSQCALSTIAVLLNDAALMEDALTFLRSYNASAEEKARLASSATWRTRSLLAFCAALLLALAFLVYELYCPGSFQNCAYKI